MAAPIDDSDDAPTSVFDPRLRAVMISVMMLVALGAFEGLAVIAALPEIAADLGRVELLPWTVTLYLMVAGVATVAAGALVDRVGVAAVFRVSVSVFVLASGLCGLAPDMVTLVLGRALQGAGAGAVNAVGLSAIGLVMPRRLVGRAFATNSNVWGVMSVAGPAIAAALLAFASWRWIFLVNLPLGGLALAMGWRALPGRRADAPESAPLRGFDLLLISVFGLCSLLAIDALDWRSAPTGVAALVAAVWLVRRSRGRKDALLAPRHALDAPLGPLSWGIAAALVGAIGAQTFLPIYVSGGRGVGTELAAWTVLFFVLGWTSGANVSSRLMERLPAPRLVLFGASAVPVALLVLGTCIFVAAPIWPMLALLYAVGLGCGVSTNAAITLVRSLAEDAELGRATAAHQYIRNLGFTFGNAVVGAVLLFVVGHMTGDVELLRAVLGGSELPEGAATVADAIEIGYGVGVLSAAMVAALGLWPLRRLERRLARERDADQAGV